MNDMTISIRCPQCGKTGEAPAQFEGRVAKCNGCGGRFVTASIAGSRPFASEDAVAPPPAPIGQLPDVPLATHSESGGTDAWKVGSVIAGLYRVDAVFTGGGMGLVYRVHHEGWNLDLAVKCPRAEFFETPAQRENFVAEANTWVELGLHPHIASCFYVREMDGIPRVFAEYVDGGSLSDWIRTGRLYKGESGLAIERILDIAIQFAWGLDFAHERGLVHQDVKPANVLMTGEGVAKVSDFGLAKARATTGGTQFSSVSGGSILISSGGLTPAYASPEQLSRSKLTRRTDIWSWAVSILEMFTGSVTWRSGAIAPHVLEDFLENGAEEQKAPPMPSSLGDLLRRCLSEDPSIRPASLRLVADELRSVYRSATGRDYARQLPQAVTALADTLNNKAISLVDLGRREEAEKTLIEALHAQAGHQQASYNLALLKWQTGRVSDEYVLGLADAEHKVIFRQLCLDLLCGEAPINSPASQFDLKPSCVLSVRPDGISTLKSSRGTSLLTLFPERDPMQSPSGRLRLAKGQSRIDKEKYLGADGHEYERVVFENHCIEIYSVSSGRLLQRLNNASPFLSMWFSPDERQVVTGHKNGVIQLWDVVTGQVVSKFYDFVLKPNIIESGMREKLIEKSKIKPEIFERYFSVVDRGQKPANVLALFWGADGNHVLLGCGQRVNKGLEEPFHNMACLYNVATGNYERIFMGHEDYVTSVALNKDCSQAYSGSEDGTIRVWNVESGLCLTAFEHAKKAGRAVTRLELSPDERFLKATLCFPENTEDQVVRIYDLATPYPPVPFVVVKPQNVVEALEKEQTSSGALQKVQGARTSAEAAQLLRHARETPGLEQHPALIEAWEKVGSRGQRTSVRGAWLVATFKSHTKIINRFGWSQTGRVAFSCGEEAVAHLYDGVNGAFKSSLVHPDSEENIEDGRIENHVLGVVFSPDDCSVATIDEFWNLRLWNAASGVLSSEGGSTVAIAGVHGYPLFLAACGRAESAYVSLRDFNTGKEIRSFSGHKWTVSAVAATSKAKVLLSGSYDNTVRLWHLEDGRCLRVFEGMTRLITGVEFSPNLRYVKSNSSIVSIEKLDSKCSAQPNDQDGPSMIWNTRDATVVQHPAGTIAFTHQEGVVIIGSRHPLGQGVQIWDLEKQHALCEFKDKTLGSLCRRGERETLLLLHNNLNHNWELWRLNAQGFNMLFAVPQRDLPQERVELNPDGTRFLAAGPFDVSLWRIDWDYEFDV